jgi:type II restriction/modification system DNA methylase subunit YeeA
MDTSRLKKFAQYARRSLIEQVESKLKLVLAEESEARREYPKAIADLEKKLSDQAEDQLIEQVAYIWFNRFCALRFMDVNQYNRIMVISPLAGQFQPEILAEAKAGHIDDGIVNEANREKVFGLLSGAIASRDGQSEAFRLLIVAVCNDLHRIMPYLFERIEDYTELLMPDDLLSGNSILTYTREAMTPEACESVESIGWLYQFYISEKKDEVFDGLKKNKKITPENIPAATQLFTPHWIVRYLVENSLGRLWMLNNPNSKVIEQMDYYIKPAPAADGGEQEEDFLKIGSPEEIKVCDPACGSGHMLTYAYDLLYAIYLDAGYDSTEIPGKILTNNLYGIEIDERAAELAAFALTMKAVKGNPRDDGNNRRRFFRNPVEPNICRLGKVVLNDQELDSYIDFVGKDLFTKDLKATLKEFEEADNFGSLIQPTLKAPADVLAALEAKDVSGELFLVDTHKSVLKVLKQAEYLSKKYHIIAANPPYMNSKGMTDRTKSYAEEKYKHVKSNLFSMFMSAMYGLVVRGGYMGYMTPISWMSLSSFERLRSELFSKSSITSFVQPEYNAFWDSAHVAICAFTLSNSKNKEYLGNYINLAGFYGGNVQSEKVLEAIRNPDCGYHYKSKISDFEKIPGAPVAYWIKGVDNFSKGKIVDGFESGGRNKTHNNELYLRYVWEVPQSDKWVDYANGGDFRKYSGNNFEVINWSEDARSFYASHGGLSNSKYWGKEGICWSLVTSAITGFRIKYSGQQYSSGSPTIFNDSFTCDLGLLGFLNSPVSSYYLKAITPTVNTTVNDVFSLPSITLTSDVSENVKKLIEISEDDWNSFEISKRFKKLRTLEFLDEGSSLRETIYKHRGYWNNKIIDYKSAEEFNNREVIDSYGLVEEVSPTVPLELVTLGRNPKYKYGSDKNEEELEFLCLRDELLEFVSYGVGCMFGRFSLDKDGLVLAKQGDTLKQYLERVPQTVFIPDDDNVIPLIDFEGDWFEDDISERFKQFLKVTFGEERFSENLAFVEGTIGKDIKKFFLKDFYADHVKRYKKRPIYWMFSSPKGSFNALIYMHRYNKDTVSIVLNDYLREFRTKLQARKESYEQIEVSASASQKEKTQAIKSIQKINKVQDEINDYEHETLYPLAGKPPEIDLDDGVKHNYPLFGKALKKVTGLS